MRIEEAIAKLRMLVTAEGEIDLTRCRRLVMFAVNRITDVQRAADIADRLNFQIAGIELAEIVGAQRQIQVDQVIELIAELENAARAN